MWNVRHKQGFLGGKGFLPFHATHTKKKSLISWHSSSRPECSKQLPNQRISRYLQGEGKLMYNAFMNDLVTGVHVLPYGVWTCTVFLLESMHHIANVFFYKHFKQSCLSKHIPFKLLVIWKKKCGIPSLPLLFYIHYKYLVILMKFYAICAKHFGYSLLSV